MKLGVRAAVEDERGPSRVIVWNTGATTDLSAVGLTVGVLLVFLGCLVFTLASRDGAVRTLVFLAACLSGGCLAIALVGWLVAVLVNRIIGSGDDLR